MMDFLLNAVTNLIFRRGREATGALSDVAEPARPSGRCKGGHYPEPVNRAGDEQVMGLQDLLKDL
ncbi:hypothetical protein [Klebsiella sp. GG_Kp178]|uniref:hypothetical protein n=1 Tax=Klebsiella sp. GG_Kp178 TaxID=3153489 RepID=UPI0032B3C468